MLDISAQPVTKTARETLERRLKNCFELVLRGGSSTVALESALLAVQAYEAGECDEIDDSAHPEEVKI